MCTMLFQVVRTLIIVLVVFILCWGPSIVYNFLKAYDILKVSRSYSMSEEAVQATVNWLQIVNSAINPIMYGLFSR